MTGTYLDWLGPEMPTPDFHLDENYDRCTCCNGHAPVDAQNFGELVYCPNGHCVVEL